MHHLFLLTQLLSVSLYGTLQTSPFGIPESAILANISTGEDDVGCCDDDDDMGEVDEDILIDEEESNDDEGVNN